MSDTPRSPMQRLADLWFYAPVGLALRPDQAIEDLARTGREQVALARMIGRFAVDQGRRRVDGLADQLPIVEGLTALAEGFGLKLPDAVIPADPDVAGNGAASGARSTNGAATESSEARAERATKAAAPSDGAEATAATTGGDEAVETATGNGDVPEADSLAIPGYGSLAASHVVRRLAGLDPTELDAVRRFEIAHRNRRTVLGRIAQLQGAGDTDGA